MRFTRTNGTYKATRKDGQVITIEKADDSGWVARYEGDDNGDNTEFFKTLKQAKEAETNIEGRL